MHPYTLYKHIKHDWRYCLTNFLYLVWASVKAETTNRNPGCLQSVRRRTLNSPCVLNALRSLKEGQNKAKEGNTMHTAPGSDNTLVHYSTCPFECPRLRDFTQYILFTVLIKSVNKRVKKSIHMAHLPSCCSIFIRQQIVGVASAGRALWCVGMRIHVFETCIRAQRHARGCWECHDRLNPPREICETDQLRHYRKRATITSVPGARADVEASIGLCCLGVVWKVRVPRPDTRPLPLKKRKTQFWS